MAGNYPWISFSGVPSTPVQPLAARARSFERLARDTFDVLVVGGGITGAGVARDAAMRGLRTALVEQDDFASGTSSRSSRLVHGGVRYLEHGQLALVFESSAERRTLQRIAPHLVRPLAFVWPVYAGARVPRWKLAAGLTLYDLLALFRNVGRHERLGADGVVAREPRVRREALVGGARYWDASTDDARLTLATVRSAIAAGAVAVNHARVASLRVVDGRVRGAHVVDAATGRGMDVSARVVVNATGPWSDAVERLADGAARPAVRGSKGVHVNVPRERIGNSGALTLLAPSDGRVMFVLPSGDLTIIGTTDTYETVQPDQVRASEADVAYLLDAANHFFPDARLGRDDVVSAWAGLRPLKANGTGTDNPSAASREHTVAQHVPGLVSVTGGKLTTYRAMAGQVVDVVQRSLGERPTRSSTAREPLTGGRIGAPGSEIAAAFALTRDEAVATRLVHAFGDEWRAVWALAVEDAALAVPVEPSRPYLMAELLFAVRHEQALTIGDLLIRRVPLAFETRDHGRAAARRIAASVARWLGWSPVEMRAAIAEYDAAIERMFRVEGRGA
jgi:glycerol-3-phosphate dehydrogenase